MKLEDNYTKSKFRCPLCGLLIGCNEESGSLICDLKELAEHVKECRKRVKPNHEPEHSHRS